MDEEPSVYASYVRFEPPDIYFATFVGDISADDMRRMAGEQRRLSEGKSYLLALADVSRIGSVPAEARKALAESSGGMNVRGLAVVGASFPIRAILSLVLKAIHILHKVSHNEVRFFETEADARAWLAERRAVVLAECGA